MFILRIIIKANVKKERGKYNHSFWIYAFTLARIIKSIMLTTTKITPTINDE